MSIFHTEPMQHTSIFMCFDDAPLVSVVLAKTGLFDPSRATRKDENLSDRQGASYRRIFNHALLNWNKSIEYLAVTPHAEVKEIFAIDKSELLKIDQRLTDIWKICMQHKEQQRLLKNQLNSLLRLFKLLDHFKDLDVNLGLIKNSFELLDVRLGIIPLVYISRLKDALAIEGYFLSIYLQEGDSAHVIVAGVRQTSDNIQLLLESASFQTLHIPDEFHEHPKMVYEKLIKEQTQLLQQVHTLEHEYTVLTETLNNEIQQLGNLLTLAKPYAVLSKQMLRKGQLTEIDGWVPLSKMTMIKKSFDNYIKHPVVVNVRKPKPEEYDITPSCLLRPKWLEPFINLISGFGVPGYREFDPSWFFTLSYILMFGVMFGDVGHGFCIIALSWVMRKKWSVFAYFFLSIGISSTLFGLIYGSFFSFENMLPAIWLSPIEHPMLMLKLSLIWGMLFIISLNIISIYNRLITMQIKEALFNPQGVAGLLLYMAILWIVYNIISNQITHLNYLLAALPLVAIFAYYWHKQTGHFVERLLVSIIESYDVIIVYLSNTVSFLRVAAFTLNHSALAIALLTLAGMSDGGGHWITIIFGNLFIILFEGAIVAIQVLRLEYYEGFSRFFTGEGHLFKPLDLLPKKLLQ